MSLTSLIATGTKVWLDGVEPDELEKNRAWGVTGATSNPTIVSKIIGRGHFDDRIGDLIRQGLTDDQIAWALDDELVESASKAFLLAWERTEGDDGYVSFELDPLIEDEAAGLDHSERVRRYLELGRKWAAGHTNRMIKVPASAAGLDALEGLATAGVTINVTLMFTGRQYQLARDAIWRGAQRRKDGLRDFKSVYSVFVSRVDVYTEEHAPELSPAAQGMVGIVNAKRVWRENQAFWRDKGLRLQQEIVFASTGVKRPGDPPDRYVAAFAGGDIQTNPPPTNEAVEKSSKSYTRHIDQMPSPEVVGEIDRTVDMAALERGLMAEGIKKFVEPQRALLRLIARKRAAQLARGSRPPGPGPQHTGEDQAMATRTEIGVELAGVHLCCQGCVNAANAALKSVEGVGSRCDMENGTVTLTASDDSAARKALDALAAAGFYGTSDNPNLAMKPVGDVPRGKVKRVKVSGIHNCCGPCCRAIKGAIATVDGVTGDTVEPGVTTFEVIGDFHAAALVESFNAAGFSARVT